MHPPEHQDGAEARGFGDWVLRAVPDGLWMLDDEGRTTFANSTMGALLGRDDEEMSTTSVFDVLDEDGGAQFREHLARRDAEAPGHDLECLVHRRDGSSFWALVSHTRVLDDDGAFRGWLYRIRDDTEHRALYDELSHRGQQLAEAQSIAGVGSWERLATGPVSWSDEAYRVCRVTPESFDPSLDTFFELLHPEDRESVRPHYVRMVTQGDALDVECRLRPDAGAETWLRVRGVAQLDEDGDLVRVGGTLQDITVAKNYQRGLEFLSAMAGVANESRTLQEVLVASDREVRPYARWPAVLVGAPASAEPGAPLVHIDLEWSAASPATRSLARSLADEAVQRGRPIHRAVPGGDHLVAGPVLVGDRLACVIVSDTTSPEEPEPTDLAFFEQTLTLLAQVAEREWAAEDLATARDAALAASRAKSEFLATMSHEIRTPLNGVIGLSELLRRTDLTAHQQRLADGVDQAGRTLLALVNDILDLSKIEAGRLDLEEVDFDPRAVVEQSAALVADRAREKGLELVVSSAADLPALVRGDPVRFGQVITNLASNAVKFTAQGEVVIRAEHVGQQVRVAVRDTGVGIAPEVQGRLFESFTQADSSTTREYGGTGLGLAISKRIVAAMGGEIGVQSAVGLGSTFWFTATFAAALGEHHSRRDAVRENAVAGLRVLVVDDNATNRFILTEQLSGWAVEVAAVASAYEALVELDAAARMGSPYEIVLLDYMMPGADGEQLARIVRAESRHSGTRLVLLSSSTEPTDSWLADAGIDGYLAKPVLPSRLLDTLASLGGHGEGTSEVPDGAAHTPSQPVDRGLVLVVEDNAINQLVADGVLRRLGFTVQLADNGAAGVAAVADDPGAFVIILMDCQMPVMDGFDATRAVRAIQRGDTRTPIIAMTAAAGVEERERCLDAGMDDFMSKPVDVRLLTEMLDRWVPVDASAAPSVARLSSAPAGHSPAPAPATTRSRLAELVDDEGIDLVLVARMVERFEASATDAVAALARSLEQGSPAGVEQQAHGLRGSAANLGLVEVAAWCGELEEEARRGRLPQARALDNLREALDQGVEQLRAFVEDRTSAPG
ncbi:response regulator [Nocardioides sp.]|uniref:response regulator n=1 Tax=Nocardioides sp. TaxID=35761 RepID=UPI003218E1B1